MSEYDLIIFDCDGTLTDSEEGYFHAFSETLRKFGFEPPETETYQTDYAGKVLKDLVELYFGTIRQAAPEGFIEHHRSLEPQYILQYTKAITGAAEAVEALSKVFPVCIASNAGVPAIQRGLDKVGLKKYFPDNIIFSKDHVDRPKPAPDIYLHAAKVMGVAPSRAIVIEDSAAGTMAGIAAGMEVIGFAGSARNIAAKTESLTRAGAGAVFATWDEIVAHISRLTGKAI